MTHGRAREVLYHPYDREKAMVAPRGLACVRGLAAGMWHHQASYPALLTAGQAPFALQAMMHVPSSTSYYSRLGKSYLMVFNYIFNIQNPKLKGNLTENIN